MSSTKTAFSLPNCNTDRTLTSPKVGIHAVARSVSISRARSQWLSIIRLQLRPQRHRLFDAGTLGSLPKSSRPLLSCPVTAHQLPAQHPDHPPLLRDPIHLASFDYHSTSDNVSADRLAGPTTSNLITPCHHRLSVTATVAYLARPPPFVFIPRMLPPTVLHGHRPAPHHGPRRCWHLQRAEGEAEWG